MAIINAKNGSFGSRTTEIVPPTFIITVSTAKKDIFKGLSTMIAEGSFPVVRFCGKLVYSRSLTAADRRQFHDFVAASPDEAGEAGTSLDKAMQAVFDGLKEQGVVTEAINVAWKRCLTTRCTRRPAQSAGRRLPRSACAGRG